MKWAGRHVTSPSESMNVLSRIVTVVAVENAMNSGVRYASVPAVPVQSVDPQLTHEFPAMTTFRSLQLRRMPAIGKFRIVLFVIRAFESVLLSTEYQPMP